MWPIGSRTMAERHTHHYILARTSGLTVDLRDILKAVQASGISIKGGGRADWVQGIIKCEEEHD